MFNYEIIIPTGITLTSDQLMRVAMATDSVELEAWSDAPSNALALSLRVAVELELNASFREVIAELLPDPRVRILELTPPDSY